MWSALLPDEAGKQQGQHKSTHNIYGKRVKPAIKDQKSGRKKRPTNTDPEEDHGPVHLGSTQPYCVVF